MPISKNGKQYYTDEQLDKAVNCPMSTLDYARSQGYQIEQRGSVHRLKDHDSLIFFPNGSWHQYSSGKGGDVLSFLTTFEKIPFKEAVLILNGEEITYEEGKIKSIKKLESVGAREDRSAVTEKKEFILPQTTDKLKRLFAYLIKTRCIDGEIVQNLVDQKKICLSTVNYSGKEINNILFIGYDENGLAQNAYQRSCHDLPNVPAFKRDVAGSNKTYPFTMEGKGNIVKVYEAAIDAMSHATIEKAEGKPWEKAYRIALGGVFEKALLYFLDQHPEIDRVYLNLDNDEPGRQASEKIVKELSARGFDDEHIFIETPFNKDWNEDLLLRSKATAEHESTFRPSEKEQEM